MKILQTQDITFTLLVNKLPFKLKTQSRSFLPIYWTSQSAQCTYFQDKVCFASCIFDRKVRSSKYKDSVIKEFNFSTL